MGLYMKTVKSDSNTEKAYVELLPITDRVFATKKLAVALIFALVFSGAAGLADHAVVNPESDKLPVLAMPVEYVNYTITSVNGTLWAKIDGTYPIYLLASSDGASCIPEDLPMVYPTPPGTENFQAWVNGTEILCSDWPYNTHHTAIGNWTMVYCEISPVSGYFLLTIHYEHPVEVVNGSSLFLYDLNIRDYLTELSNTSVAYFKMKFETSVSDVHAYTTFTDTVWNPKNFTSNTTCGVETVSIEMHSAMDEPLAGDLVVMFNDSSAHIHEPSPYWLLAVPAFMVAGLLAVIVYRRRQK